ncbi:MAG: SRPBCC family protein [Gammaproteobacteria bacterium]|nr:SRPBCC family protein [Gammaproteobacteria bacterium]MDH3416298.1 SRPBCC family protein [Gammaproteobacteria bacterium]
MIKGSRALEINPPGTPTDKVLTRDTLWPTLVSKATHAVPFVKDITACRVIDHSETGFVREAEVYGETIQENIVLFPKNRILFERMSGVVGGYIENIVEDSDKGLLLRFTYELSNAGSNAEEERAYAKNLEEGYLDTIATVIDHARSQLP